MVERDYILCCKFILNCVWSERTKLALRGWVSLFVIRRRIAKVLLQGRGSFVTQPTTRVAYLLYNCLHNLHSTTAMGIQKIQFSTKSAKSQELFFQQKMFRTKFTCNFATYDFYNLLNDLKTLTLPANVALELSYFCWSNLWRSLSSTSCFGLELKKTLKRIDVISSRRLSFAWKYNCRRQWTAFPTV